MKREIDPETGLNTIGFNGRGKALAGIANHVGLLLLRSAVQIVGIPVGIFFLIQIYSAQVEINKQVFINRQDIAVQDVKLSDYGRRLDKHDDILAVIQRHSR